MCWSLLHSDTAAQSLNPNISLTRPCIFASNSQFRGSRYGRTLFAILMSNLSLSFFIISDHVLIALVVQAVTAGSAACHAFQEGIIEKLSSTQNV